MMRKIYLDRLALISDVMSKDAMRSRDAMRKQRKDRKERRPKLRISRQRLVFTAPIPSSPMRIVDRDRASKA